MKLELITSAARDLYVVNAARVSFANQVDVMSKRDEGLIKFLMRERHGSPFEHGFFQFRVEAPIFVFREWHRHRVGHSYNEMSGRYVEVNPDLVYLPSEWREQEGKPGAYTFKPMDLDEHEENFLNQEMTSAYRAARDSYRHLISAGVAKEQARAVLPLGVYSQMIWSCNPRSLMHFIGLRNAPNALKEIQVLASSAEDHLENSMPVTYKAFIDNERRSP